MPKSRLHLSEARASVRGVRDQGDVRPARDQADVRAVNDQNDEIDLMQLFGALWRGKWVVLFFAFLAALMGGYYAYKVAVPKYAATTTLALQVRNENIVELDSVLSGVSTESSALNTELEVIRSRGLIEQLVVKLRLLEDPEFNSILRPKPKYSLRLLVAWGREMAGMPTPEMSPPSDEALLIGTVNAVRASISASNQRNTYIFNIGANTESAVKSAAMANTLAQLYISDQISVKFRATENAVVWLSERVVSLEAELLQTEQAIAKLRSDSELVSPQALDLLNRQAKDVGDRLSETRLEMGRAQVRLEELLGLKEGGTAAEMVASHNDAPLNRLFAMLEAGGDQARQSFEARFDFLVARAQTNLDRSSLQIEALERSSEQFLERIKSQSEALSKMEQLSREADATRVLYETFLTRLKETTVQRGLQQADSRILSMATPGRYVEPQKTRILALSIFLGGLIGAGLVLLRQMLHNGFRTAEDLEAFTGMPVLGQIPRIPIGQRGNLVRYLNDKPTSAAAEAIRNLRTSVLLSDIDTPPQVIMSTSSIPGEGKTTQSIALAQNLSGLGKNVLLIEGDIRRRTFGKYFKSNAKGGILTALAGEVPLKELIVRDDRLGADVLMGEKSSVNAADVFSSDRFREFLKSARQAYDYIVIDTPPVLVVPDARVIGQSVDAIIYSVTWDDTSKSQVSEGLRQFASVNLRVTGLVLAQIDPKGMKRYGYGGKYGAYSRYGKKYYEV